VHDCDGVPDGKSDRTRSTISCPTNPDPRRTFSGCHPVENTDCVTPRLGREFALRGSRPHAVAMARQRTTMRRTFSKPLTSTPGRDGYSSRRFI